MKEPQVKGRLLSECCDGVPYMDIYPDWTEYGWIGMCRTCGEHSTFYDDAAEEELADKEDDRRRWNDDDPKLNANARAEEEFGKRLEQRGPGER